jgi:hypothetical protein
MKALSPSADPPSSSTSSCPDLCRQPILLLHHHHHHHHHPLVILARTSLRRRTVRKKKIQSKLVQNSCFGPVLIELSRTVWHGAADKTEERLTAEASPART